MVIIEKRKRFIVWRAINCYFTQGLFLKTTITYVSNITVSGIIQYEQYDVKLMCNQIFFKIQCSHLKWIQVEKNLVHLVTAWHVAPPQEGQSLDGCVCRAREIGAGVGRFKGHRGPCQNLDRRFTKVRENQLSSKLSSHVRV